MARSSNKSGLASLPKNIRDELRTTAAMYCYSILRQGRGKTKAEICNAMSDLFHGKESTPSHIKMLANASYSFKAIYDTTTESIVDKASTSNSSASIQKHTLKTSLTLDESRLYVSGIDITALDLEKTYRSNDQLMSGRQILDLAKKGTGNYRKALAFASRKFDLETMSCIESGTTQDDVIRFVLDEMYKNLNSKVVKEEVIDVDNNVFENDIVENEDELEEEIIIGEHNTSTNNNNNSTKSIDKTNSEDDNSKSNPESDKSDNASKMPKGWFFPGWFCFMSFGPFVPKEKRLSLLEISDPHKDIVKSRAQKRKAEQIEKDAKRAADTENSRGLSTDQQLQVEMLNIQKKRDHDRNRETLLVGLSMQEAAICRQIEMLDKRATMLETKGSNHNLWDKIDNLLKKQEEVLAQISEINRIGMQNQIDTSATSNNIPTEIYQVSYSSNPGSAVSSTSSSSLHPSHTTTTTQKTLIQQNNRNTLQPNISTTMEEHNNVSHYV